MRLQAAPTWMLSGGLLLGMVLSWLIFYRVGRHLSRKTTFHELGRIEDAIGILLALVLAFALTSAEEKFDTRERQGVYEANAMGTCFQRCDLLDPALIEVCKDHIRRYVDVHVAEHRHRDGDIAVSSFLARTQRIQDELWKIVMEAMRRSPPSPRDPLFINAMNEMIDAHELRSSTRFHIVQDAVVIMTFAVCFVWACTSSYSYGLKRYQPLLAWVGFTLLAVTIVHLTLDLNRNRGLIVPTRSRGALEELSRQLHQEP